jgi:hypothetical protein
MRNGGRIPQDCGRQRGIFILQIVLRRLLEGKIVPLVAHFEDADASEAPAGVSLMNTTASLNATHA